MSDTSNNFADVLCVSPLSMNPISGRRLREVHATFRPRPYLAWKLSRPESLRPTRIRMSPDRRGRRLRRSRRSCPCRRTPSATPLKIQICTLLSQKATSLGVGHFRHLGIGKLYFLAIFGQWILGIQFFTTGWNICWRCWIDRSVFLPLLQDQKLLQKQKQKLLPDTEAPVYAEAPVETGAPVVTESHHSYIGLQKLW